MYNSYQAMKTETTRNLKEESEQAMAKGELKGQDRALYRQKLAQHLGAHWATFSVSKKLEQQERAAAVKMEKASSQREKTKKTRETKALVAKNKREAAAKVKVEAKEAKKAAGKAPSKKAKTRPKKTLTKRSGRHRVDSEASQSSSDTNSSLSGEDAEDPGKSESEADGSDDEQSSVGAFSALDFTIEECSELGSVLAWGGGKNGKAVVFAGVTDKIVYSGEGVSKIVESVIGQYIQPVVLGRPVGKWVRSVVADTNDPWLFQVNRTQTQDKVDDHIHASDVFAIVDWEMDGVVITGGTWSDECVLTEAEWGVLLSNLKDLF